MRCASIAPYKLRLTALRFECALRPCASSAPYGPYFCGSDGLIRQYFPKKTDFTTLSGKEIAEVERKLNNRPRKRRGFKSPNQVFKEGNLLNQKTN